jgi:phosphatidylglycerophosphate synthase
MLGNPTRRPLKSRDTHWARAVASRLAATGLTPNRISQGAILFAAIAGAAFWLSGSIEGISRIACLLLAAAGCQLRLLCNLFDGMVAVEGGKSEPDGPFWNEAPDRLADILILVGAGLGTGSPGLGWAAATAAVLTAYLRELGRAEGGPADFGGPMAKQHRMAVMTGAALVATLLPDVSIITLALWIVAAGAFGTAAIRSVRLIRFLVSRR